jgi:hypothetical protein
MKTIQDVARLFLKDSAPRLKRDLCLNDCLRYRLWLSNKQARWILNVADREGYKLVGNGPGQGHVLNFKITERTFGMLVVVGRMNALVIRTIDCRNWKNGDRI